MQQRQLRLGDVLDDYCPRERRVTNHAVVAMVGDDVRLTRCTTCDAEHDYKHARVPRQRRKPDTAPALHTQVAATGPKRVTHEPPAPHSLPESTPGASAFEPSLPESPNGPLAAAPGLPDLDAEGEQEERHEIEGPVHRPLIRATLPRLEGQAPPTRPGPDFTIRQPAGAGRANRFRFRHQRGGQSFFGNGASGNGPMRAGSRQPGGRAPQIPRPKTRGAGRKRSK